MTGTTIILGGQPYALRYDWAALKQLRERVGIDFEARINRAAIDLNLEVVAETIAVGLSDPAMTADAVFRASPPILPALEAVRRAMNVAFRGTEEAPVDRTARPPESPAARMTLWRKLRRLHTELG